MSGNDKTTDGEWYLLRDEANDEPVGQIDAHGNTRDTSPETAARVREAFDRELLVRDGEVVEDLGMCFDGICSVPPGDPKHDALVLKNLGALAGLRPERREETE